MESVLARLTGFANSVVEWALSPQFYSQCGLIVLAVTASYILSYTIRKYLGKSRDTGPFAVVGEKLRAASDLLSEEVREVVASHPKVLSGDDIPIEERPDAEIAGFGDSGINILVEFWMEGIDDGKNRVGADLLHMIWKTLREHNIEIPFPQREVRILNREGGD